MPVRRTHWARTRLSPPPTRRPALASAGVFRSTCRACYAVMSVLSPRSMTWRPSRCMKGPGVVGRVIAVRGCPGRASLRADEHALAKGPSRGQDRRGRTPLLSRSGRGVLSDNAVPALLATSSPLRSGWLARARSPRQSAGGRRGSDLLGLGLRRTPFSSSSRAKAHGQRTDHHREGERHVVDQIAAPHSPGLE